MKSSRSVFHLVIKFCKRFNLIQRARIPSGLLNVLSHLAFDSLDRAALWNLLLSIGLPQKIVDLMKELYTDTVSAVRIYGHLSEWFTTGSGVRQVCTIAPNIFLPPMDTILNRTVETAQIDTTLGTEIFTDLDFADDVALL